MVYKGYELIKAIENQEIEKGTRFKDKKGKEYKYSNFSDFDEKKLTLLVIDEDATWAPTFADILDNEFEIIENKIDKIDLLSERNKDTYAGDVRTMAIENRFKINELVQAVKQLDRNIKDKE